MKKFLAIALLAFVGCVPDPGSPEEATAEGQASYVTGYALPAEATNIRALKGGNGWHTFDLVVDGQKRRFLRHVSGGDSATESMVEITPR